MNILTDAVKGTHCAYALRLEGDAHAHEDDYVGPTCDFYKRESLSTRGQPQEEPSGPHYTHRPTLWMWCLALPLFRQLAWNADCGGSTQGNARITTACMERNFACSNPCGILPQVGKTSDPPWNP